MIWEEGTDNYFLSPATNIDDVKFADAEIGIYKLVATRKFKLVEDK